MTYITDIERRKNLTYITFNKYRLTLTCQNLPIYLRIRLFDVYVASIFMYDSELWTLKNLRKKIDAFHRQLLRQFFFPLVYLQAGTGRRPTGLLTPSRRSVGLYKH